MSATSNPVRDVNEHAHKRSWSWTSLTGLGNVGEIETQFLSKTSTTYKRGLARDVPIHSYGDWAKENSMINRLPDVAKMRGIVLCKEGCPPQDWYFMIQYTGKDNNLHEIKVPLLDGLHLLNLLREAEKDQHLEFQNRDELPIQRFDRASIGHSRK